MAARGRPKAELVLSTEERLTLERLANRRKSAQAMAMRARIVMCCAKGETNRAVAEKLGVSQAMVSKWRRRFVEHRLDGLFDEQRPGAPRTITDDEVEKVIVKTLEEKPKDATHWSTRSMAGAVGMSQTTVSRIWRAFGLQPHRAESNKASTDPYSVEKVRDVVGLYLDPPERAVVLCVDEKSQIQALNRFQPILPMMPGTDSAGLTTSAPRNHVSLRRLGHGIGQGDRLAHPAPPGDRVQEVLGPDRRADPQGPRRPPDPRQLRHPQDARDPSLAAAPPALSPALHADLGLVAQHGRAMVRRGPRRR